MTAPTGGVDAYLCEREAALSALGKPWSVLALGGYGVGRLHPGSDLDTLTATLTAALVPDTTVADRASPSITLDSRPARYDSMKHRTRRTG